MTSRFQFGNVMRMTHPLKTFRETNQLSQPELARLLGVGRSAVHRWESGARRIDEELVPKIASITGIPAKELRPDAVEKHERIFGEPESAQ